MRRDRLPTPFIASHPIPNHSDQFGDRLGQRLGDWLGPWLGDRFSRGES